MAFVNKPCSPALLTGSAGRHNLEAIVPRWMRIIKNLRIPAPLMAILVLSRNIGYLKGKKNLNSRLLNHEIISD